MFEKKLQLESEFCGVQYQRLGGCRDFCVSRGKPSKHIGKAVELEQFIVRKDVRDKSFGKCHSHGLQRLLDARPLKHRHGLNLIEVGRNLESRELELVLEKAFSSCWSTFLGTLTASDLSKPGLATVSQKKFSDLLKRKMVRWFYSSSYLGWLKAQAATYFSATSSFIETLLGAPTLLLTPVP